MDDVATPTATALTRLREAVDGLIEAVAAGGLEQLDAAEKFAREVRTVARVGGTAATAAAGRPRADPRRPNS